MKGRLTYMVYLRGLRWKAFDTPSSHPSVTGINVTEPNNDVFYIHIHTRDIPTPEEARKFTDEVAETLVNRMAIIKEFIPASDPVYVTGYVSDELNNERGSYIVRGIGDASFTGTLVIGPENIEPIKTAMSSKNLEGEKHFPRFRHALAHENPVDQFQALYLILASFFRMDNQDQVDKLIMECDPTTPQSRSPKDPSKMETVYTRLRNESIHNRPGIEFNKTQFATMRDEMIQHMDGLKRIVREAIKRQGP